MRYLDWYEAHDDPENYEATRCERVRELAAFVSNTEAFRGRIRSGVDEGRALLKLAPAELLF